MKGEIRELKAGNYYSKDGTLLLKINKSDNGVIVEIADFEADIFYAANIDGKEVRFEFGHISSEINKEKENGKD